MTLETFVSHSVPTVNIKYMVTKWLLDRHSTFL